MRQRSELAPVVDPEVAVFRAVILQAKRDLEAALAFPPGASWVPKETWAQACETAAWVGGDCFALVCEYGDLDPAKVLRELEPLAAEFRLRVKALKQRKTPALRCCKPRQVKAAA